MGSISYEEFLGDVHSKRKESITESYTDCQLSENKGNNLDELLGHLEREDAFCPFTSSQKEERKECFSPGTEEQQEETTLEKREQKWLEVLSNPLYIGLKWLWSTNLENSNRNKLTGVIASALHESHLPEELAKCEHHYSRDDYLARASRLENFAAGVVGQGNSKELHEVMDTDGTGTLVAIDKDKNIDHARENRNYSASIGLLKTAVVKGRKKVSLS